VILDNLSCVKYDLIFSSLFNILRTLFSCIINGVELVEGISFDEIIGGIELIKGISLNAGIGGVELIEGISLNGGISGVELVEGISLNGIIDGGVELVEGISYNEIVASCIRSSGSIFAVVSSYISIGGSRSFTPSN